MLENHEMVPGRKYKITLADYCIQGEIYGRFVRWETYISVINNGTIWDRAIFDIGEIGPDGGGWWVREVDDAPDF